MTYEEFRRHLGKAGLTTKEFANLVKLNRNSITNCAKRGAVPSHLAVISALLGEMAEHKVDFYSVMSRIEITHKKPRGAGFSRDLDLCAKSQETNGSSDLEAALGNAFEKFT